MTVENSGASGTTAQENKRGHAGGKKNSGKMLNSKVWREVVSWFWVILVFLLVEGALVQARVIPSGSMENTVLIGDHLILSRIGYDAGIPFTSWQVPLWREPKRQQIMAFRSPFMEDGGYPDLIKRTIGLPGDTIEIKQGVVFVNGQALAEPYRPDPPNPMENSGPYSVPAGNYFMLGDNRENSYDSRYWGFVPRANMIGTPVFIYMSIDAPEEDWDPGHLSERFETYLSAALHPSEIRWKRLFHTF